MDRKRLLKHLAYLMFFIFILNSIGLKFYLYYLVWYFDIILHTLGGAWVGLFFFYVFSRNTEVPSGLKSFFKVILGVIVVGLLWEVYEYIVLNYMGGTPWDMVDSSHDIIFDTLGGFLAYFYVKKVIMLEHSNKVE